MTQEEAFRAIQSERVLQDALYGMPDGSSMSEMVHGNTIGMYVGKMHAAISDGNVDQYRRRLIQVAALAVQGLEAMDRHIAQEESLLEHVRRVA